MSRLLKDPINMVVAGVGGQGNVMISLIIGSALVNNGYFITIGETYGASQRGGSVMSHVKISANRQYSPLIPLGQADIILGMEPVETLRMLQCFGNDCVTTVVNPRAIHGIDLTGTNGYPDMQRLLENISALSKITYCVNATDHAQKMGNPILANVILIGALIQTDLLPLDEATIKKVIIAMFPRASESNMKALTDGMEQIRNQMS